MKRLCVFLVTSLFAVGILAAPPPVAKPAQLPPDSVYQLPVQLTDQQARHFAWSSRRGKPQLVAMFYTSCQYICPLIVDSGKAIEKNLSATERQRLGILLISMDPVRDTPARLLSVATARGLDPAGWTLASPAARDVRSVAGVLGIRYRALADGAFNHTSALVLLDAQGRILARTETMGSQPDPGFVAAVRHALVPVAPRQKPVAAKSSG
ncbi:MAG TPA: SCO family protein [Luteimonas sp.]|nr:SCO family protein [Luteimonas sp.]